MSDVFISYSRKDKEFAETLHTALETSGKDAWIDWQDIPLTSEWWKEIEAGIEGADTFIFVISPDSVASKVCGEEIGHAVKHNKRLFPVVRRDAQFDPNNEAFLALNKYNWLFFRREDDFEQSFQKLITALSMDLGYVHNHTRLLVKAIEWDTNNRKEGSLLQKEILRESENWLKTAIDKDPKPTDLQVIYIENSRKVEDANNKAVLILKEAKETAEKQIEEANLQVAEAKTKVETSNLQVKEAKIKVETAEVRKKQIVRQGLIFLGVIVVGAGTALSLAGFKMLEAQNNLENTNIRVGATEAKALWIENPQTLDNLLIALKAGGQLQNHRSAK